MQKRNLSRIKALVFEWGKWRRSEDSLARLGYVSPTLIPNTSSLDRIYAPPELLEGIDDAIKIMKTDQFDGYDLLRERFYYRTSLKDCAKNFGVTETKASQILDHLLSWLDGHIYSQLRAAGLEMQEDDS